MKFGAASATLLPDAVSEAAFLAFAEILGPFLASALVFVGPDVFLAFFLGGASEAAAVESVTACTEGLPWAEEDFDAGLEDV